MFQKLLETNCPDFKSEVKLCRNQWVRNPSATDENTIIAEFINLYTNFKANGEWDKHVANSKEATIIALVTALAAAKKAVADATGAQDEKPLAPLKSIDNSNGPPAWKCTKEGTFANCPITGNRFKWCPHHGKRNQEVRGMYMPEDHDHTAWAKKRKDRDDAYNAKKKREAETAPASE